MQNICQQCGCNVDNLKICPRCGNNLVDIPKRKDVIVYPKYDRYANQITELEKKINNMWTWAWIFIILFYPVAIYLFIVRYQLKKELEELKQIRYPQRRYFTK